LALLVQPRENTKTAFGQALSLFDAGVSNNSSSRKQEILRKKLQERSYGLV
jgi:hypothetical protein